VLKVTAKVLDTKENEQPLIQIEMLDPTPYRGRPINLSILMTDRGAMALCNAIDLVREKFEAEGIRSCTVAESEIDV
jgi:hypothetical protein